MQAVVPKPVFRATPVVDFQVFISQTAPAAPPPSFTTEQFGEAWVSLDKRLRRTRFVDREGREFGVGFGIIYESYGKDFVRVSEVKVPDEVGSVADFETKILPQLAGSFVFFTGRHLPHRLYLDHAGSMPMVYSPADRTAASSPSLLLDEPEYKSRFLTEFHAAMVAREGSGAWISGTLTAHRGVYRLLANHYLDLKSWEVARFWPRPGDFKEWRDFSTASVEAAEAIRDFSRAVFRNYRTATTLTAGFDTRLVLASCRADTDRCQFFTITAPHAEKDVDISKRIAARFDLNHRILQLRPADAIQTAVWDRTVGDTIIEAPRLTYPTLQHELADFDVQLTGLFGEIGRCRYYRQDLQTINEVKIDAQFVVSRLTIPQHPDMVANIQAWLDGLAGQPNSVILDLALHELKLGSWGMPQRTMMSTVKLSLMPFAQRVVFDRLTGVRPMEKDTKTLFWAMIVHLWPELKQFPINKYGDLNDQLLLLRKLFNRGSVQRLLRDRSAKKLDA